MSFNETDRTWIRHFAGFSAIFGQADPRLESAITAIQSVSDGGSRPDSSGENYIKACIYGQAGVTGGSTGVTIGGAAQNVTFNVPSVRGLIQIEANIAQLDAFMGATQADGGDTKVDAGRETIRLRLEGRRVAYAMCRMLGMKRPRVNVFSGSGDMNADANPYPFSGDDSPIWG